MSRITSGADQALIDVLARRGVTVTPRQLERWREAGIIWTRRWRGEGRGGSRSEYPVGTADQVMVLLDLLAESKSLDVAVLSLFGQGREVQHLGLVDAYLRSYKLLTEYGEGEDAWDRAEGVTRMRQFSSHPVVRAWRQGIRDRPNRTDPVPFETQSTGASVVHSLQTGEPPMEDAAGIIAEASGFGVIAESDQMTKDFADTLAALSIPALIEVVSTASMEELKQARDVLVRLAGGLMQISEVFRQLDYLQTALVAPALIQIMRLVGPWWEEFLPVETA